MMKQAMLAILFTAAAGLALWVLPGAAQDSVTTLSRPDRVIAVTPADALALSPDGTLLAVGGRDHLIRLYRVADGELYAMLSGHEAWVTQLTFTPDGGTLLSGSHDGTLRLWQVDQRLEQARFDHHAGATVTGIAVSPNGHLAASIDVNGLIWLGDLSSGETLATLSHYSGPAWSIAFSQDGRSLATGGEDGAIWRWQLYDGGGVAAVAPASGSPTAALHFLPDGRLASAHWDGVVRVWDDAGGLRQQLDAHSGPVTALAYDAVRDHLVSSSLDGSVRLWRAADGGLIAVLTDDSRAPLSAVALRSGTVATADLLGTVNLWALDDRLPQDSATAAPPAPSLTPSAATATTAPPDGPLSAAELAFIPTAAFVPTAPYRPPTSAPRTMQPPDGDAAPPPTAAPVLAESPPAEGTHLSLPTANIFSGLTSFPIAEGTWQIDPWERAVGHFQGTAWITAPGNIVLGGHSEYPDGGRGIFNGLYGVNIGDPVYLTVDGQQRRYIVTEKRTVRFDDLSVVYPSATDRLTLITCDIPSFDSSADVYWERLVIVAVPG